MSPTLHPEAQACGKIILLGEHAVVHGVPALAAGLPGGVQLFAEPLADRYDPIRLQIPDWDLALTLTADQEHPVARACAEVLAHCDGPLFGYAIRGVSGLPPQAGLGSSAALSVAIARLCLGPDADLDEVVAASMAGERIFHGEPSGIDSEVAARGGVLRFVRGEAPEPIPFPGVLRLIVVPSGKPRSTADQVAKVRALKDRFPTLVRPILDAFGAATELGIAALKSGNHDDLGAIFSTVHELLSALGVSSSILDDLCLTARTAGSPGAKLTGAGGGGCILALPGGDDQVLAALRRKSPTAFCVEVQSA